MTVRWGNAVAETTCTKCGVHVDVSHIFCTSCEAVLQTPMPLIKSAPEGYGPASCSLNPTKRIDAKFIARVALGGWFLDIVIDALPDHVMNVAVVVTASVLFLCILLVAYGTVTKNGWGVNLEPVFCPACGSPTRKVRRPESLRQALWGGGTCGQCGCEMDKWGRLIGLRH